MRLLVILILIFPAKALSQGGFDLSQAIDDRRNPASELNKAMAPFYNGRFTRADVGKPSVEMDGQQVKVTYPVEVSTVEMDSKIGRITKLLDRIGKPLGYLFKRVKEQTRQDRSGKRIRYYQIDNLQSGVPQDHIRFFVNGGFKASSVRAWDVPKTKLDLKTMREYLGSTGNPILLKLGLTTTPNSRGEATKWWSKNDAFIAVETKRLGMRQAGKRTFLGAHFRGNYVFINKLPFRRGKSFVKWAVNQPAQVNVRFSLDADRARTVKGAKFAVRSKRRFPPKKIKQKIK